MQAVANNPKFAKKAGVKQGVGKEFAAADKKKKGKGKPFPFAKGGSVDGAAMRGHTKGKCV